MGRSPLTLAALATNALDGLSVTGARPHTWGGEGEYDSAVVTTNDGRYLIFRVPTTRTAESKASAELAALSALSAGVRSRLPFVVPVPVGHTPVGPTIGRLYEYAPGGPLSIRDIKGSGPLSASVGRTIAAIHNVPTAVIDDFGLPHDSAASVAAEAAVIVDRAQATGRLPAVVAERWEAALQDDTIWTFTPTVVHADLSESSFSVSGSVVAGVFGWWKFRIADPAADLAWFIDLPGVSFDIFEAYLAARETPADTAIRERALFHRELDLARWLLHGVDTGDTAIVDDGARMLRSLNADIERGAAAPLAPVPVVEPANETETETGPAVATVPATAPEEGVDEVLDTDDAPATAEAVEAVEAVEATQVLDAEDAASVSGSEQTVNPAAAQEDPADAGTDVQIETSVIDDGSAVDGEGESESESESESEGEGAGATAEAPTMTLPTHPPTTAGP